MNSHIVNEFNIYQDKLWKFTNPDNSWKEVTEKRKLIHERLSRFCDSHSDDPEHIDKVVKCLIRGVSLLESAINWHEPYIGKNRKNYARSRASQWRLVMTYSGFEITAKALMNKFNRSEGADATQKIIDKCNLPNYEKIDSPNPNKKGNFDKWLTKEEATENAIAEFLGVTSGDAKIIKRWIAQSEPIESWENAVKLAKALRNASAHGFLLAKKVKDWGLEPGIAILAGNLAEIVTIGLKTLIAEDLE